MAQRRLVTSELWKRQAGDRSGLGVIKSVSSRPEAPTDVKALLEQRGVKAPNPSDLERVLLWTISTEAKDRERDVIRQRGWGLKNYKTNPVVMWGHNYSTPPIGRSLDVFVDEGGRGGALRLRAIKQFTSQDVNPFGHMIYRLSAEGYLKAASVGFYPQKWAEMKNEKGDPDGFEFTKAELLESSVVPIPANPEALQGAKSVSGIDLAPYVPWAEEILDNRDAYSAPIKSIESIRIIAGGQKSLVIVGADLEQDTMDEETETKDVDETSETKSVDENVDESNESAETKSDASTEAKSADHEWAHVGIMKCHGLTLEVGEDVEDKTIDQAIAFLASLKSATDDAQDSGPDTKTAETKGESKSAESDDDAPTNTTPGTLTIDAKTLEKVFNSAFGITETAEA